MSRRRPLHQDSLELLLDTICNTFGGVLFISILVVLLLKQTRPGPQPSDSESFPAASPSDIEAMTIALEEATAELSRLEVNQRSQETLAQQFAPDAVRDLVRRRQDAAARQAELQRQVDHLRAANARSAAKVDSLGVATRSIQSGRADAAIRNEAARAALQKERDSRRQEVRLPVVRSSAGKQEIGLILRYGRLYVWHRYGPGLVRMGLNTDDFAVVSDDGGTLTTRAIPTRGTPLDDSQASSSAIDSVLKRFDPDTCHLTIVARPDSYHVFRYLRDRAIAAGFDYRLMPSKEDSPVSDRGGTADKVQ